MEALASLGESQCRLSEFWSKDLLSSVESIPHSRNGLLLGLLETEHLNMENQVNMQPELSPMNCCLTHQAIKLGVLSSTASLSRSGMFTTVSEKAHRAQVSYTKKQFKGPSSPFLISFLFSPLN